MRSFIQMEGSHIATAEEIREFCRKDAFSAGHENGGGTPVYWDGNEMVRLSGNYHISVTGTTGSGKTMSVLLNTIYSLMEAGESLLITDPKAGELYKHSVHFARQNGYGVKVLNFSDPMRSNCYNPFSPIVQTWNKGARELSDQLLYEIADSLYSRFETSKDPFWGMTAANYFCGIGKILRQENADLTFSSIMNLNIQGKEGVLRNRLKTWLELFDEDNYITHDLTSTIDSPKDTRLSIEAVFASPLSVYCRSGMETMMSHSDFEWTDLGRKKMVVYILTPPTRSTFHPMVSLLLRQAMMLLTDGEPLKRPVSFVMEEFGSLPKIEDLAITISTARSYRLRFIFSMQSFSQLITKYGEDEANTILNNCLAIYVMRSKDKKFYDQIIHPLCGERILPYTQEKLPLCSFSDIRQFRKGQTLILIDGCSPFITNLPQITDLVDVRMASLHKIPQKKNARPVRRFNLEESISDARYKQILKQIEENERELKQNDAELDIDEAIALFSSSAGKKGKNKKDDPPQE